MSTTNASDRGMPILAVAAVVPGPSVVAHPTWR